MDSVTTSGGRGGRTLGAAGMPQRGVPGDRFPYLVSILDASETHRCSGVLYGDGTSKESSLVLADTACIRQLEPRPVVIINPHGAEHHQLYPRIKLRVAVVHILDNWVSTSVDNHHRASPSIAVLTLPHPVNIPAPVLAYSSYEIDHHYDVARLELENEDMKMRQYGIIDGKQCEKLRGYGHQMFCAATRDLFGEPGSAGDPIVVLDSCHVYSESWPNAESYDNVDCGNPQNDVVVGLVSAPKLGPIDQKVMAIAIHHFREQIIHINPKTQKRVWMWRLMLVGLIGFPAIMMVPMMLHNNWRGPAGHEL